MPVEKDNPNKKELLVDLNDPDNQDKWIIGTPTVIPESSDAYSKWVQIVHLNTTSNAPRNGEVYHRHEESEEYYLVIQGSITVLVDETPYQVKAMNLLAIPKGICHKVTDIEEVPLRYLVIRAPSAKPEEKIVCETPKL